jgi:hypothetical protein
MQSAILRFYGLVSDRRYEFGLLIVVVKKTLRYSNVFFYNRTSAYAPIPLFGIL